MSSVLFSEKLVRSVAAAAILITFAGCGSGTGSGNAADSTQAKPVKDTTATAKSGIPSLKPQGPKPGWGPSITDNMLVVIEKLKSFNAPPTETLSAAAARKEPTPTDAVMAVMKDNQIPMPAALTDTIGKEIPVAGGDIHVRIYTPKNGAASLPVIVYYHGGGFVIADVNTYDASAAGLSAQTGSLVFSVEYRKGPEHKFPTAHNDAFAAYQWVLKNAGSMKGDTSKIALVGESAGGNLACNVSIMARDKKIKMPLYQVLVYPVANNDMADESYKKYDSAKPLNKPMMAWFGKNYMPNMAATADPRFSLVKANLKGLPPTTIIGAEIDPLQSEGQLLSEKLKAANVTVDYKLYNGVTHEFFGMATVLDEAKDAQSLASSDLKKAFNK